METGQRGIPTHLPSDEMTAVIFGSSLTATARNLHWAGASRNSYWAGQEGGNKGVAGEKKGLSKAETLKTETLQDIDLPLGHGTRRLGSVTQDTSGPVPSRPGNYSIPKPDHGSKILRPGKLPEVRNP